MARAMLPGGGAFSGHIDEVRFYERALGFEREFFRGPEGQPRHALKFGRHKINLQDRATETPTMPAPRTITESQKAIRKITKPAATGWLPTHVTRLLKKSVSIDRL